MAKVKNSKRYFYSYDSFSTKLFPNVLCDSPHRICLWKFRKFKLLKKKIKSFIEMEPYGSVFIKFLVGISKKF